MKRASSDASAFELWLPIPTQGMDICILSVCLWCNALVVVAIEITTNKCAQIRFITWRCEALCHIGL